MAQEEIINRLNKIEKMLEHIKENMIDADTILTQEEKKMLDESVINEKKGRLVSFERIKNVRNKTR